LCVYKIIRSVPYIIDYKASTLFETVFADHKGRSAFVHLIDVLSHCSVGRTNMDLSKNMTIDLLNVDSIAHQEVVAQWRDVAGFIVSDKHRLEEVLVYRSNLLSLSDPASTIVIVSITKGNLVSVLDYDADLSIYDRSEHVTALIQTPGITGMLALDEGQPCGYALLCKNRVLLLYANNEEIFKQLLSGIAKDIVNDQCKMFLRLGAHNVTEQIIEFKALEAVLATEVAVFPLNKNLARLETVQ
uniref:Acetyltransf_18 domain-containing protein n=1 Tax=Angiostrongylus cantonensis TaxID=6313 RepID=A0A0K0D6K8_ANGCA